MIKEIGPGEYGLVEDFLKTDIARNYFTLLGITSERSPYQEIYGDFEKEKLRALLFLRKTGTLQFYAEDDFDLKGLSNLIKTLNYRAMIGPRSYCDVFLADGLFSSAEAGAYIAELAWSGKLIQREVEPRLKQLTLGDIDQIVELYKTCFPSFSPRSVMEKKLVTGRGRGVCLEEEGRIVSVAQSDFEVEGEALIVGVATYSSHRNRGLASLCLKELIHQLQREKKNLYLQYDNLDAGKIYERLGFRIIDQVRHYKL